MNRSILAVIVTLFCTLTTYSQRTETRATSQASAEAAASASKAGKSLEIASGTHIAGDLQSTVDVRKAKVGDQVVLKTTKAIKSGGQTVVSKGAKLFGHVTEVTQKTKGNAVSRVGLVFDRLENGSLAFPISATISSITSSRASARTGDDDLFATDAGASSSSSMRTSSSGQSGGLLGGVTSTTGAVVNTTTSTTSNVVGSTPAAVGSTVDSTTNVVGGTTTGLGRSLGRIQISESSSTSAEGGAVLSLRGDNIRLEKGTSFNLVLNQSASAGVAKEQ